MSKQTLFISDLHLSAERPETIRSFLQFLQNTQNTTQSLYILGDFFDAWIGDDYIQPPIPEIKSAIKNYSQLVDVYFMAGNRDFLIGDRFCQDTGIQKLDDVCIVNIQGEDTLLLHGDQLCTDDIEYQKAKLMLRNKAFIADFLSKPLNVRAAIAAEYRSKSGEAVSMKADDIMDVNQNTVERYLTDFNVKRMIHGHTHRPAKHTLSIQGKDAIRYVLPEWQGGKASYLAISDSKIELIS